MRHHRNVPRFLGEAHGVEGLGEGADLVEFDQHGVGGFLLDAAADEARVGDKQVIAHELAPVAELTCQIDPAGPIVLRHAVFHGVDRIAADQFVDVRHLLGAVALGCLVRRAARGGLEQAVIVDAVLVKLRCRAIQRQRDVPVLVGASGLVTGGLDRLQDGLDGVLRAVEDRREAALVADGGGKVALLQDRAQGVEDLGTGAQRLFEAVQPVRADHELLKRDRGVGVRSAVDDVHHRHRQGGGVALGQIAEQRGVRGGGGGARGGQRYGQDGVRAQAGLELRAVQIDHAAVDGGLVGGGHAGDGGGQLGLDVLDRAGHALAAIARGILVAQLERLALAGGSARRHSGARVHSAGEGDFRFNRGCAARVQNFTGRYCLDRGVHLCSSVFSKRYMRASPLNRLVI